VAQQQPQPRAGNPELSVLVAHAAGMVAAQLNCNLATALILLRKRAELIGCSLEVVATAVIGRRISFEH
jgi:hypothetical protein